MLRNCQNSLRIIVRQIAAATNITLLELSPDTRRIIQVESWRKSGLPSHSTRRHFVIDYNADAVISSLARFGQKGSWRWRGGVSSFQRQDSAIMRITEPEWKCCLREKGEEFRVSGGEDPLTASLDSISIQTPAIILDHRFRWWKDRKSGTPGRSITGFTKANTLPSMISSTVVRIIRSVRLNKTIARATALQNSSIPISYLRYIYITRAETIFDRPYLIARDRNRPRISRMYGVQ